MRQKTQRLLAIRLLVPTKDGKNVSEILKLSLSPNKEDFYLFRKKNELKVSFHKEGTKYLRFQSDDKKYEATLFKNEHYSLNGINPIFSYFPSETSSNKITPSSSSVKSRTANVILSPRSSDYGINVYWVNAFRKDQFLLPSNACNITMKCKAYLTDGSSKSDVFNKPTAIEFGHQTLYFDMFDIKKSPVSRKYEILRIYKPGTENHILANTNHIVNADITSLDEQGCSIVRNHSNGYYTLVY